MASAAPTHPSQPHSSSRTSALTAAELLHALNHELSDEWYVKDQKLQRDWTVAASTDADGKQLSPLHTATRFIEQLAQLAEQQQHQLDIHLSQLQQINVTLYDHAAKCIGRHDIQLALAIDALPQPPLSQQHRTGQQRKEQELSEQKANVNRWDPILQNFPSHILTPRLKLRPFKEGDGAMLHKLITASWTPIGRYMGWNTKPSIDQCESQARKMCSQWIDKSNLCFAVLDRTTGTMLGVTGLHRLTWHESVIRCDVGYSCHAKHVGKGYASESANATVRFAHKYFAPSNKPVRVDILCSETNTSSRKVAERLHFHLDTIRTEVWDFEPEATCVYSVSLDELPPLEVEYVHNQ